MTPYPPPDPTVIPPAHDTIERTSVLPADLLQSVADFASHDRILIAADFDGVLAPLVLNPADSRPLPGSMETLTELAALPDTSVSLVSGRALDQLSTLSGAQPPILMIGSHGAQDSRVPDGLALDDRQRALLASLDVELGQVAQAHPGARVEIKPTSRVLHTRGIDPEVGAAALAAALEVAHRHTDLVCTPGKEVVELSVTRADKGSALVQLAGDERADAVFFIGDDVTDESGFEALAAEEDSDRAARRLTVKVGPGETAALARVADEAAALDLLGALLQARRSWLPGT